MASLLGQFYTRIKGSQEDIASEGLAYILQQSQSARRVLSNLIRLETNLDLGDLSYVTQNVGAQLERPDISGYNIEGKEVVILEAKFWAALTDNQPLGYLNRLSEKGVLLFICPNLRVRPVYDELQRRLSTAGVRFESKLGEAIIQLNETRYLLVKTWNQVLGTIRIQLAQDGDQSLLSDLDQIIGLCETIDSNAFRPFRNEDFSPVRARQINSFYDLTDKVVDELKRQCLADTTGLKTTPQRHGYTRYFKMGTLGVQLELRFDFWEKIADTPFWLCFKEDLPESKFWSQSSSFKTRLKWVASKRNSLAYETARRELFLPLFPLLEQTEDVVVSHFANQIAAIYKLLTENQPSPELENQPVHPIPESSKEDS